MNRLTVVGCGWFGLPLARHMVGQGWQVAGSVRDAGRARALADDGIAGFALDLRDAAFPAAPFRDALVVIAIPPGQGRGAHAAAAAVYQAGAVRLLDHAAAQGGRAIALISSTSVYRGLTGEVDEEAEPVADDHVMVQLERHLATFLVPGCAVRFGGLIGPDRHPGRFLAGRTDVRGGARRVNLVRREDCVRAVALLLDTPLDAWPPRVNVVSTDHPARQDYYPAAAAALGLTPPTFAPDAEPASGRVVRSGWLASRGFAFSTL